MWKTLIVLAMVGCGDPEPLDPLGVWDMTGTWVGAGTCYGIDTSKPVREIITVVGAPGSYGLSASGHPSNATMNAVFTCNADSCTMLFHVEATIETGSYELDYTVSFNPDNVITGEGIFQMTPTGSSTSCRQDIDLAGTKS